MLTVHMIGNAHIDPVWLWRWPAGVGEVLATCRTACDLLDEDRELVFTRPDVWVYRQVEEIDTALFRRIRRHVRSGRWAVVGGWYIQPDCNFPREESFRKHIESGKRYFQDRFGLSVTVGYNVDSFGHAASLPRILAEAGYDSYVMMRPAQHEKSLPAGIFRWRSTVEAGGVREVLTWRVTVAYCIAAADLGGHVKASIAAAAPGVDHVMCFYGVGDHGGGPTREQVAWIHANRDAFPGARLEFSHPRAFFDAVKPLSSKLPVVQGELQMHAIGCYSAGRSIKKAAREAEHGLIMAENAASTLGAGREPAVRAALDRAWEKLMFNQFHDTYGGTAVPAACEDAVGQMASARDEADRVLYTTLFRHAASLPPAAHQRIVALNASDTPFDGFIEWEPWLGGWKQAALSMTDAEGRSVTSQALPSPSVANMPGVLTWHARLGAGAIGTWFIRPVSSPAKPAVSLAAGTDSVANARWRVAAAEPPGLLRVQDLRPGSLLAGGTDLQLQVLEDPSDTWSHGLERYSGEIAGSFVATAFHGEETGPVRASLRVDAKFNESTAVAWARLYDDDPRITLEIRIDWREKLRLLKLVLPVAGMAGERLDGIPGGGNTREQDGRERPIVDWTLVNGAGGSLGIALPDCAGLDGTPDMLRFTLLRSPAYSWHDPAVLPPGRALRFMDQGEHTFRFTVLPDADVSRINAIALGLHRPPACIDWTRGMTQD